MLILECFRILQRHRGRFPHCVPIGHLLCVHRVRCQKHQRIGRRLVQIGIGILHFDAVAATDCLELHPQFEAPRTILNRSKYHHFRRHHFDSSLYSRWIAIVIGTWYVWRYRWIPAVLRTYLNFQLNMSESKLNKYAIEIRRGPHCSPLKRWALSSRWRAIWRHRNHSEQLSVYSMLVCCSSPCCTRLSVSWATGSMERFRMKVSPWIYPAQTCKQNYSITNYLGIPFNGTHFFSFSSASRKSSRLYLRWPHSYRTACSATFQLKLFGPTTCRNGSVENWSGNSSFVSQSSWSHVSEGHQ